jgi:hypothetical protein
VDQDLAQEEGVPLGLPGECVGQGFGYLVGSQGLEELANLGLFEAPQQDALVLHLASQRGQGVGQGVLAGQLHVAVSADQEQSAAGCKAGQVPEQGDGRLVGPVQIVEDDEHGSPLGCREEQLADCIEEPLALLVGLENGELREIWKLLPERRSDGANRCAEGAEVVSQLRGIGIPRVILQCLGERCVVARGFALVAASPEDLRPEGAGPFRELLEGAGLPDARLSDDHDQAAGPFAGLVEGGQKPSDFLAAAHERCLRREGHHTLGLVDHLRDADGCGDSLEIHGAEILESECLASRQEADHGLAGEDLSAAALAAKPRRDHHRRTEVAASGLLPQHLAHVEPCADLEAVSGDGSKGCPLHGDGAAHRVGGGGEAGHEPVAEPLQLLSAVAGQQLRESTVMGLEESLGCLVTQTLGELGAIHQVRAEDAGDRGLGPCGHGGSMAEAVGTRPAEDCSPRAGVQELWLPRISSGPS